MGNGIGKIGVCFTGGGAGDLKGNELRRRSREVNIVISDPYDEGLGHSFCYVPPEPHQNPSKVHSEDSGAGAVFRSISGASVSANNSTPLSTSFFDSNNTTSVSSAFESSNSFASIPLQPVPRNSAYSGPISGPISDRGFMSGPIERGFMSGPIDRDGPMFSGPLERGFSASFRRSQSQSGWPRFGPRSRPRSIIRGIRRAFSKKISRGQSSIIAPMKGFSAMKYQENWIVGGCERNHADSDLNNDDDDLFEEQHDRNLQWAQGKAGEDRVHVVVSEEHGWVFVGIYDGFNGPDATDFLLSNLYSYVHKELKGLLYDDKVESQSEFEENRPSVSGQSDFSPNSRDKRICNLDVLKSLSQALKKTEESYFDIADKVLVENPELSLMGSCVLVMLMKGEDVYVMNVGDSRAVLAHKAEPDLRIRKADQDLERINEESMYDVEVCDGVRATLGASQLTLDHSTSVNEEVQRVRREHLDDSSSIVNERVKGSLKVTRAFGAGFLKQRKWNDALLEMFRIDYVGNSPYINCLPHLCHHRLGPKDRFLILSSDGLYQYFTNEEAVAEVELFLSLSPDGDPAQHLVEEVLFRAAKKVGLDFYELLEIPQGERRRYHDDVSVIVISFEGRIWRSCV